MLLPDFDAGGDLPPGIYPVTLAQALDRFGRGTPRRQVVAQRLIEVYNLATSTGHLARFVVFGSFVTAKLNPRDVDVMLVMDDAFDRAATPPDTAVLFDHAEQPMRLSGRASSGRPGRGLSVMFRG